MQTTRETPAPRSTRTRAVPAESELNGSKIQGPRATPFLLEWGQYDDDGHNWDTYQNLVRFLKEQGEPDPAAFDQMGWATVGTLQGTTKRIVKAYRLDDETFTAPDGTVYRDFALLAMPYSGNIVRGNETRGGNYTASEADLVDQYGAMGFHPVVRILDWTLVDFESPTFLKPGDHVDNSLRRIWLRVERLIRQAMGESDSEDDDEE